jgi:hypothetical protein
MGQGDSIMPLSINVGLSRKASKDYQSTGVSINVMAELDQSLLARPDELQQEVANLYAQAEQALDRQAGRPEPQAASPARRQYPARSNGGYRNGNGNGTRPNGNANASGGMTDSQRRAIIAIARRPMPTRGLRPARSSACRWTS